MRKILMAVVVSGLCGGAYAAEFSEINGLNASGVKAEVQLEGMPVPKAAACQLSEDEIRAGDIQQVVESVAAADAEMAYGASYMFDPQYPAAEGLARVKKAESILAAAAESVLKLVPASSTPDKELNRAAKLLQVMADAISAHAVAYKLIDEKTHTFTNKPFVSIIHKAGELSLAAMTLDRKTRQK
ncbi:MAG: hypothetical protein PHV33_08660 [Elusimicrobiales bacterium]|nr:hypothetical protein [Elusimicrobiales bacterium]